MRALILMAILISSLIISTLVHDELLHREPVGEYYFWFIEKVRDGDRGQWFNCAGSNSTLLENFYYIHSLPYASDQELYHCFDHYARASEFYVNKAGDCEDKAIAFASAAYYLGEPYNKKNYVKVVLGNVNINYTSQLNKSNLSLLLACYGTGHAWVEINDMVYDPTAGLILNKTAFYDYYVPRGYPWTSDDFFWFSYEGSSGLAFQPVFCYF